MITSVVNGQIDDSTYYKSNNFLGLSNISGLSNSVCKFVDSRTIDYSDNQASETGIVEILNNYINSQLQFRNEVSSISKRRPDYRIYQQYFNGIRVDGATLVLSLDPSTKKVTKLKSFLKTGINISSIPNKSALEVKNVFGDTQFEDIELVITDRYSGNFKLVWKIAHFDGYLKTSFLDDSSGVILETFDSRAFLPGNARIYGLQPLNNFENNGTFHMKTPDLNIKVYEGIGYSNHLDFDETDIPTTSNQDNWHSDATEQSMGVFYAADIAKPILQSELDAFFSNVNINAFGSSSFINSNSDLQSSYIHIAGGQGDIETLAHELMHAYSFEFLNYTGLGNRSLHEGLSMVFAILTEGIHQGTIDWVAFDDDNDPINDIDLSIHACFSNPPNILDTEQHNLGLTLVHWFHLLVEGDASLGIEELELDHIRDVMLEALPNVGSNGNIPTFRDETMIIAEQLYGVCSDDYKSMANAWSEVCLVVDPIECLCDNLDSPEVTETYVQNECPQDFVSLDDYSPDPNVFWSTDNNPSNGLQAVYENNVTSSGIYFGYFYVQSQDCYGPPSAPIEVEIENCCVETSDLIISNNTIIDYDFVVGGNLIVTQGATLRIESAHIEFLNGKGLIVQEGGSLEINFSTLTSCDQLGTWQGIVLEEANSFKMSNTWIVNAHIGIELHDLATPLATFHDNLFRDCYYGIRTLWAENINLNGLPNNPNGQIFGHNLFQTCEYGIATTGGAGSIKYALFDQCDQGINISQSRGKITVQHCEIGFLDRYGIRAYDSDVKILDNVIGEPTIIGGGVGKIGIVVSNSSIDIRNNIIEANEKGISTAFVFSDRNAIIDHNTVEINGNNDYGVTGIYNWWTQDVTVRDNRVFGSGQDVGIYALNCFSNKVEENTVAAYGSDNGIAITGGSDNEIERNLVENNPTNGLLNTSSINNAYHDNDVSASNQGLSIEPLSKTQTITCNRFCSGNYDLNIESNLDRDPDHFWNRFRQDGSRARVIGLTSNEIAESRFFYDPEEDSEEIPCAEVELFVEDDPAGLFDPNDDVSYIHCVEDAGSSLKKLTPETLCDEVMALSAKDYWLKLRQLLGRYFDTHGPRRLPDCIPDCMMTEVAILEAELRAAMKGNEQESSDNNLSQSERFRQTATEQYNRLGGGQATIVVYDKEPCGPKDEIYLETYKMVVKEISSNSLGEGDLSGLKAVASLCYHEYGEVVGWARGLLDLYEEAFIESDCTRQAIEYRAVETIQPNLNISPVPASDVLSVQLDVIEDDSEGQLWVMDISGRILLRKNVSGSNTYNLPVTNLEEGYYIISYNGSTISNMTKSFVVHR